MKRQSQEAQRNVTNQGQEQVKTQSFSQIPVNRVYALCFVQRRSLKEWNSDRHTKNVHATYPCFFTYEAKLVAEEIQNTKTCHCLQHWCSKKFFNAGATQIKKEVTRFLL